MRRARAAPLFTFSFNVFLSSLAGTIIQWPGLCGFVLSFITPPLLQLRSKKLCAEQFGTSATPYSIKGISSNALAYTVLVFGVGGLIYSFINIVNDLVHATGC